jgi:ribonuclease HII
VILPREVFLPDVADSKLLNPKQRESCYREIVAVAVSIGTGIVEAPQIDEINILQATFRAMVVALGRLDPTPDYLLIDGPYRLPVPISQRGVTGGDRLCLSIAAASIIAKVHRDRLMCEYHQLYPQYDFQNNKGYGTRSHLEALLHYGPCPLHRKSFRGVLSPGLG